MEQESGTRITVLPHAHLESPNFNLHYDPDGLAPASYDRILVTEEQLNIDRGYDVNWQTPTPTQTPDKTQTNHWQQSPQPKTLAKEAPQGNLPTPPTTQKTEAKPAQPAAVAWLSNLFAPKPQANLAHSFNNQNAASAIESIVNTGATSLGAMGQISLPVTEAPKVVSQPKAQPAQKETQKDNKKPTYNRPPQKSDKKPSDKQDKNKQDNKDNKDKSDKYDNKTDNKALKREPNSVRESRGEIVREPTLTAKHDKAYDKSNDKGEKSNDKNDKIADKVNDKAFDKSAISDKGEKVKSAQKPTTDKAEKTDKVEKTVAKEPSIAKIQKASDGFALHILPTAVQSNSKLVHLPLDNSKAIVRAENRTENQAAPNNSTVDNAVSHTASDTANTADVAPAAIISTTADALPSQARPADEPPHITPPVGMTTANTAERPSTTLDSVPQKTKDIADEVVSQDKPDVVIGSTIGAENIGAENANTKNISTANIDTQTMANSNLDANSPTGVATLNNANELTTSNTPLSNERSPTDVQNDGQHANHIADTIASTDRTDKETDSQANNIPSFAISTHQLVVQRASFGATAKADRALAQHLAYKHRLAVNDPRIVQLATPSQPTAITGTAGQFIRQRLPNADMLIAKFGVVACFIQALDSQDQTAPFANYGYLPLSEQAWQQFGTQIQATDGFAILAGKTTATPPPSTRAKNDPRSLGLISTLANKATTDAPNAEAVSPTPSADTQTLTQPQADSQAQDGKSQDHKNDDNKAQADDNGWLDIIHKVANANDSESFVKAVLGDELGSQLLNSKGIGESLLNAMHAFGEKLDSIELPFGESPKNEEQKPAANKKDGQHYKNMIEGIAEQLLPQTGILNLSKPTPVKIKIKKTKDKSNKPKVEIVRRKNDDQTGE